MNLRFLLLLSLVDDFNHYESNYRYKSNYQTYEAIYRFLEGYSQSSARVAVSQLLENGDIEKIVKNDIVCFSLTLKGYRILSDNLLKPYRGFRNRWDGKWRVVIFDIPESEREKRARIRQILGSSGFGRLTNSVYVSPFDNLEVVCQKIREKIGKESKLFSFEAKQINELAENKSLSQNKTIAKTALHLDELAKKYSQWSKLVKNPNSKIDILISYYVLLLQVDPALPEELLPINWPFIKSWTIFIGLLKKKRFLSPEKTGNEHRKVPGAS